MKLQKEEALIARLNELKGLKVLERPGGKFYFLFHMTEDMSSTDISELELSVRAYNCLKRAEIHTVGSLAELITGEKESGYSLKNIRNCGRSSILEIMIKLFLFQYNSLQPERRERYIAETVELNLRRTCGGGRTRAGLNKGVFWTHILIS